MPKMKNHSGASKRLRLTASGKVRRRHQNHNHILTKKAKSRKRRLRKGAIVDKVDEKRIKRLIAN